MAEAPAAGPALRAALQPAVAWRSLRVGTLLNAINQGGVIVSDARPDWIKLALTSLVSFCVPTYGAFCACRLACGDR